MTNLLDLPEHALYKIFKALHVTDRFSLHQVLMPHYHFWSSVDNHVAMVTTSKRLLKNLEENHMTNDVLKLTKLHSFLVQNRKDPSVRDFADLCNISLYNYSLSDEVQTQESFLSEVSWCIQNKKIQKLQTLVRNPLFHDICHNTRNIAIYDICNLLCKHGDVECWDIIVTPDLYEAMPKSLFGSIINFRNDILMKMFLERCEHIDWYEVCKQDFMLIAVYYMKREENIMFMLKYITMTKEELSNLESYHILENCFEVAKVYKKMLVKSFRS